MDPWGIPHLMKRESETVEQIEHIAFLFSNELQNQLFAMPLMSYMI